MHKSLIYNALMFPCYLYTPSCVFRSSLGYLQYPIRGKCYTSTRCPDREKRINPVHVWLSDQDRPHDTGHAADLVCGCRTRGQRGSIVQQLEYLTVKETLTLQGTLSQVGFADHRGSEDGATR